MVENDRPQSLRGAPDGWALTCTAANAVRRTLAPGCTPVLTGGARECRGVSCVRFWELVLNDSTPLSGSPFRELVFPQPYPEGAGRRLLDGIGD
ncbi:MAG: hypothetical protein ACM3XO_15600 [Bacteroidota bacterium]